MCVVILWLWGRCAPVRFGLVLLCYKPRMIKCIVTAFTAPCNKVFTSTASEIFFCCCWYCIILLSYFYIYIFWPRMSWFGTAGDWTSTHPTVPQPSPEEHSSSQGETELQSPCQSNTPEPAGKANRWWCQPVNVTQSGLRKMMGGLAIITEDEQHTGTRVYSSVWFEEGFTAQTLIAHLLTA